MDPIHCPNAAECYCNVWGLCELKCSQDECEGRYELPPYSTLPEGWPHIGWNGQPQDPSEGGFPWLTDYASTLLLSNILLALTAYDSVLLLWLHCGC